MTHTPFLYELKVSVDCMSAAIAALMGSLSLCHLLRRECSLSSTGEPESAPLDIGSVIVQPFSCGVRILSPPRAGDFFISEFAIGGSPGERVCDQLQ